ncbi:hypothetical protein M1146_02745 [Patescibacteria group bacterium]|nr:hypothetical protein [Patescibacteria group bacterium]
MRAARYLVLSLLFVIFYFLFVSATVSAQSYNNPATAQPNQYTAPSTNPDVPNNLHNYTQNVLLEVMAAVSCQLTGIDPVNPKQECLGVDQKTGKIGFVENGGGAIGVMGNLITMTFTPPTHTIDYFRNLAQNFGITKHAYAVWTDDGGGSGGGSAPTTGTGFNGLSPLLPLWTAFRNIVYLLFVLVFIIIGIAIMLRVKIDPRTVMTVQNQIPKIIMGLLFVTFSFAIAGFLIDIMYTSIYLTGNVITSADPNLQKEDTVMKIAQSSNPIEAANNMGGGGEKLGLQLGLADIAWKPAKSVGNFIAPLADNPPGKVIVGLIGGFVGQAIGKKTSGIFRLVGGGLGAVLGTVINPGAGTAAGWTIGNIVGTVVSGAAGVAGGAAGFLFAKTIIGFVASTIAFLIISIAILWALIRLWFALISAYVMILIDVVFAPFWVVAGLFPGSQLSFNTWIRDIVANLAAFPATIVMFLIARVFIDAFGSTQTTGQFVPPLIANPSDTKAIGALIGLGIILATPNIVNMMKAALKAPKIDLSTIGQAVGVGTGYPISVGRGVGQTMLGREEVIMRRNQAGQYEWGARGTGRAFFGRIFGRG